MLTTVEALNMQSTVNNDAVKKKTVNNDIFIIIIPYSKQNWFNITMSCEITRDSPL